MQKDKIIEIGKQLGAEMEELAMSFHVKSSQHEILLWEAAIIRAKVDDLLFQKDVTDHLQKSVMLNDWGNAFARSHPKLYQQVAYFLKSYEQFKAQEQKTT